MKYAESQQIEAGAAVHLPLDELESVDLPFNVALTPGQLQHLGVVRLSRKWTGWKWSALGSALLWVLATRLGVLVAFCCSILGIANVAAL